MSTLELRKKLHEKIDSINDESILEEVYKILAEDTEKVYGLNTELKNALIEAQNQIKDGKTITWETSKNNTMQWLEK
jgi:hypothetical protein